MNLEQALEHLHRHKEPAVRASVVIIENKISIQKRVIKIIQEALSQIQFEHKLSCFDLEATRRERDEARSMLN